MDKSDYFRDSSEIIDLCIEIINRENSLPSVDTLLKFIEKNPVDPVTVYGENTIDWSEYQI